jgi:hypothetical protein
VGPEAAFLAGYAVALLLASAGIEALGRRPTHPWASRMLAAERPPEARRAVERSGWPHTEVPSFHLGLGAVAVGAALALTAVNLARNHAPLEVAVQAVVVLVAVARGARLVRRYRALSRPLT